MRSSVPAVPLLLAIVEIGGYPDFTPVYRQAGYEVVIAVSVRKALGLLKRSTPAVIVAEFNYQSDFRDRISNLESLLAMVQRLPQTRVIVLYEPESAHQLAKLRARFPMLEALAFPIQFQQLEAVLLRD